MDTFKQATEDLNKVAELEKINLRLETMELLRSYASRILHNTTAIGDPTSLNEMVDKHVANILAIVNAPFDIESAYNPHHGKEQNK